MFGFRRTSILLIFALVVITNINYAANVIWHDNSYDILSKEEKLIERDGLYYYTRYDNTLFKSNYKNRFRRINDTKFFVDYDGVLYVKHENSYLPVPAGMINDLAGKNITSATVVKSLGDNAFCIYEKNVCPTLTEESTIYHKSQGNDFNDKLVVVGDSFAYLFNLFSGYNTAFSCCPGYTVREIKNELVDYIPKNKFKYCFLLIGPNDYMHQTLPQDFKIELEELITELEGSGMRVIMTDYLDINYQRYNQPTSFFTVNYNIYAGIVQQVISNKSVIYIKSKDLLGKYGYGINDYIHPHKIYFEMIGERLKDEIH